MDDEGNDIGTFREVHKLAHIVECISHDTSVIPKNALLVDAHRRIIRNPAFKGYKNEVGKRRREDSQYQNNLFKIIINCHLGLSDYEATQLDSYFHFRDPDVEERRLGLDNPDFVKMQDFLDVLSEDQPKGENTFISNGGGGKSP